MGIWKAFFQERTSKLGLKSPTVAASSDGGAKAERYTPSAEVLSSH
jgi:hypothetical protein